MRGRITSTFLLSLLLLVSIAFAPNYLVYSDTYYRHAVGKSVTLPCGGPSNTDSITILPPGPVTLPADQSRIFTTTLKDSDGNTLGGTPDWSVSDGSINPQGGGDAIYYPTSIGNHTVWACASNAVASVEVIVTMGATQSIELVANKVNLTADEVVELQVLEYDLHGNSGGMFVPSSQWTIPEGSSLHAVGGQPAIWTPGPIGNQTITVNAAGFSASWDVNVSRGVGVDLVIQKDRSIITSDESLVLSMAISDIRGNLWYVDGEWSTLAPQAMVWLSSNSSNQTTFDGNLVGNWTIRAEYNGPENGYINMSDEVTIGVLVGRISLIDIQGHDSTLFTGDVLQLNPIATDLDGNTISDATFNWSIEGASGADSIDGINYTFIPTAKGQHNILAESGGKPASIRVQVEWSEPIDLNVTTTDGDWYLTVTTGETLPLHVRGLDVRGKWHSYNPNWAIDANFGSIEESGGDGDYLYHAEGVNWTQLHAFVGDSEFTILIFVTPGILDYIEISITDRGVQGESVPFTLKGFDVSGNGVSIPICDVTVTSTAGRTECNVDSWTLYLDNANEQQLVKASYENANGSGYIDVQPTLLGGQFGSSTQVIAAGAMLIAMLIAGVLIAAYLRVKRLAMEYEEEEEVENSYEPQMDQQVRHISPLPKEMVAPPPRMMPMPPSPAMPKTQSGKKVPPSPPPPSFMFGTGITSNSSSAQAIPGVFVRSDSKYGWGDPSQQPKPDYGWGQIGSTSVGIDPAPHQPQLGDPMAETPPPMPQPEEPSALSSALSMFPSPTGDIEEEDSVASEENYDNTQLESEPVSEVEPEKEEENVVSETESESTDEEQSLETQEEVDLISKDGESFSPSEEFEWEDGGQEEQPAPSENEDDNWDSWDNEWGGDETADEEAEEIRGEVTEDIEPGLGPCTEKGEVLKPLPGTKAGGTGWYFDSKGKPSLWEFRPIGWKRIK